MRFLTSLVLSVIFSHAAHADTTMAELQASIDALTKAIAPLQNTLTSTNAVVSQLASSTSSLHSLASSNLPQAQDSLAKAADALVVLGNFSTTVQQNVTPIALGSVGVIAAGIVLGSFAVIGIKQVFFAIRGCWRLRHSPQLFLGGV